VTATKLAIQAGSYPVREVLTGANLQLPGGAGALYDIFTVGPPEAPIPQKVFSGGGLYMYLTPSGGKYWRYKYHYGGREKTLSLGPYPAVLGTNGVSSADQRK
jgi:hypothetical protein